MKTSNYWICISLLVILFSCTEEKKEKPIKWTKDMSADLNKTWSEDEDLYIQKYLERRPDWKMTETGTGLRYMIYEHGEGDTARTGLYAKVNFSISLLDGTLCYSSDSTGAEDFLIDRSTVESGLQEGIKYMRVGDKAKFIIPSHIAHGLIGDLKKIPPLETVVFDIHLISLSK
jgi:FKBP-type peptidyl-prolyl cis-trans isomerase